MLHKLVSRGLDEKNGKLHKLPISLWILTNWVRYDNILTRLRHKVFDIAAMLGNVDAMSWASEHSTLITIGSEIVSRRTFPWSEKTCVISARNEQLESLKWLRAHGCRWDEDTAIAVVETGHVDILEWILSQESVCPYIPIHVQLLLGKVISLYWNC